MRKVYNFGAGPAVLPEEVLQEAQADMLDWNGTGMSAMEVGHRDPDFVPIAKGSEADLRELLGIPAHYHVLFLAGGATAQFSMVPLNLLRVNKKADYVDTGVWSHKAVVEAKRYGDIHLAASLTKKDGLSYIPEIADWSLTEDAAYLHYTPNETIEGVEFAWVPKTGSVPLVADMSSTILSRPIKVEDYGIIYACAQKNAGQAGVTIVIIRDDLVQEPSAFTPWLYQYRLHVEEHSVLNTPPTYSWYITYLTLRWLKRQGGVRVMGERNARKAGKLYNFIDAHPNFYFNTVHPRCRSWMNVSFLLRRPELTERFLQEARGAGLVNLKGHRLAGGMRASLYNAMPEAGVDALVQFMDDFAAKHR